MRDKNILIMAGGTGGHIYPALAVADYLKENGFNLFWLGTDKGLETNVIPDHGYPLLKINVVAVRGKGLVRLLIAPIMLLLALIQALLIIIKIRPVAVLGMGGFASGPGGIAAWLMRVPLLIHEQNAIAGLTNKLLAPLAVSVMTAFPGVFKETDKVTITGNPVRSDIINLSKPKERHINNDARLIKVLALGGSLGAKVLNDVIPKSLIALAADFEVEVKHQCGEKHYEVMRTAYDNSKINSEVTSFIDDMAEAYAWADVVVCRAGALTIAELAASGVASILIPFPSAVDDHQTANGNYLTTEGAAILIQEAQFTVDKLKEVLLQLINTPECLLEMAIRARSLAKPKATKLVANICMETTHV